MMREIKAIVSNVLRFLAQLTKSLLGFYTKIRNNRKAIIGFYILAFFVFIALFGRWLFPYDPSTDFANRFAPFSWTHPLSTDQLGRDVLRQLIHGTRSVLTIAFFTGLFTVSIGTFLGILSGYVGGWTDRIVQSITNLFLTIPSFPVLLLLSTMLTIKDPITFALVLSVWSWAGLCRAVRAQVISLRERDFIQICKVMNMSNRHIIFVELFPNISSYIIVNFIMTMRAAITGSIGLMVLGVAPFEPTNWGAMLQNARSLGLIDPRVVSYMMSPLLAIVLFQIGAILFANGLDEVLNPRLRVL